VTYDECSRVVELCLGSGNALTASAVHYPSLGTSSILDHCPRLILRGGVSASAAGLALALVVLVLVLVLVPGPGLLRHLTLLEGEGGAEEVPITLSPAL
jgi:hypothetical protein